MTTENKDNDGILPPAPPVYGGAVPGYSAPQAPPAPNTEAPLPPYGQSQQYAPPASPAGQNYYAAPTYGVKEPNAVLAFVMGLLGLLVFAPLAVVAVIMGRKSLNAIKANPSLEGKGMALAGFVIGWVAIGFWVLWLLLFILFMVLASVGISSEPDYSTF